MADTNTQKLEEIFAKIAELNKLAAELTKPQFTTPAPVVNSGPTCNSCGKSNCEGVGNVYWCPRF